MFLLLSDMVFPCWPVWFWGFGLFDKGRAGFVPGKKKNDGQGRGRGQGCKKGKGTCGLHVPGRSH